MIYMDYAATTPISKNVLKAMMPYLTDHFGNPSSIYSLGQKSKEAIENSRFSIANSLGCKARELYFTSGGTEADNWALKSSLINSKKNHIITTSVEHPAVLTTCRSLKARDQATVTYLPVDKVGKIDVEQLEKSITQQTALVSIMYANNEIGTIYPIEEIGRICRKRGVLFHVDGVQALGNIPIDLSELPVDMMSFSAHKIYGPKGIGLLYVKENIDLPPLIDGGAQERYRRAGTENIPSIVGFAKAVEDAVTHLEEHVKRQLELRNYLVERLLRLEGVELNGDLEHRLPGNVNISIGGIKSQMIIPFLDMRDICLSQGSACSAGSVEPSYVLHAIGRREDLLLNSLRISVGFENTKEEADTVIDAIRSGIEKFRK